MQQYFLSICDTWLNEEEQIYWIVKTELGWWVRTYRKCNMIVCSLNFHTHICWHSFFFPCLLLIFMHVHLEMLTHIYYRMYHFLFCLFFHFFLLVLCWQYFSDHFCKCVFWHSIRIWMKYFFFSFPFYVYIVSGAFRFKWRRKC